MDVIEAIKTRRSVNKVRDERPPKDVVREIVEAALWAPNHHFTQPWRFHVLAGEERRRMGERVAADMERHMGVEPGIDAATVEKARGALLRAPVVVAVTVGRSDDPEQDLEDYAAACCATQNLLLAAHAKGFAAKWRTGAMAREAAAKKHLGIGPDDRIVAYVYLGYPAGAPPVPRPRSADKIAWLGWES